jgi:hypothetical protein
VISAAIGVSDTIFEAYKAKSDSKSRAEHAEHLLHEISRNLQPITKLSASYWMEIPPGNRIVDSYIARLNKGIEERVKSLSGLPHKLRGDGIWASALENDGEPLSIEVTSKSDLWPKGEEAFIGNARPIRFSGGALIGSIVLPANAVADVKLSGLFAGHFHH